MRTGKLLLLKECLIEQMNHWFLYPLMLALLGFSQEPKPCLLVWALCSVFPFLFYVLRCEIEIFPLFFLLHGTVLGVVFLLFTRLTSLVGGVCIVCACGYTLHSLFLRITRQKSYCKPIPLHVGVAISVVAMLAQRTKGWEGYYCFALIVAIVLFFIQYYFQHYLDFLAVNKNSTGYLPASEMFRSGLGLVSIYSLLGAAIMVISTYFTGISRAMFSLKDLLMRLLWYLLSMFLKSEEPEHFDHGGSVNEDLSEALPKLPKSELSWLLEMLWKTTEIAFMVAIVILAVKLLVKFFRWLYGCLGERVTGEDIQENEAYDIREKCDLGSTMQKEKKDLFASFSYRERIRKLYKKKVVVSSVNMPEREGGRLGHYTAREWEKKLEADGMAEIYEHARYSEQELTADDVKKMREVCRRD